MSATLHPDILDVLENRRRWCVVCADNADVLPTLPDKSVDHVITDPPYSEHVHGKSRAGSRKGIDRAGNGKLVRASFSRAAEFGFASITGETMRACAEAFAFCARRWVLVFSDVELASEWRGVLTSRGLDHCRTGAWLKIGATPQFSGDRPAAGFEAITIAHRKGRKRWNGGGKHGVWSCPIELNRGGKSDRLHTTQKPLDLMTALLGDFTDPDDVVLDCFAGSGTTGVAALRLGRRAILIERDPTYAAVARERMEAEERGSTLRASRAGQLALLDVESRDELPASTAGEGASE